MESNKPRTSLAPWLSVKNGSLAVEFYKSAFGAEESYHLDGPDNSIISRLSIDGAEFWVSDESADNPSQLISGRVPVRMILTVSDPDNVFKRAITAGAKEIFPVAEEHGWRVGRLADPFGHHWEVGKMV